MGQRWMQEDDLEEMERVRDGLEVARKREERNMRGDLGLHTRTEEGGLFAGDH